MNLYKLFKLLSTHVSEHQIYNRYYHLFDENELENLIHKFKNVCIKERGYQKDNWYVIIKKI